MPSGSADTQHLIERVRSVAAGGRYLGDTSKGTPRIASKEPTRQVSTTLENWSVSAVKSEHSTIGE